MYISQLTIYGFGKWVDTSFDMKDSFTCIYGENESGKSTLQKFILFMLFGLPPRERSFYRPKTSGKMGGRLTIIDSHMGEYTIERLDERDNGQATCYLENGETRDERWLQLQLKGLSYKTYESVYSFSSLDLIGIDEIKDEDIGEIILGIGLTGSQHIYRLEKQIDQRLGHLFKPNGKIPVINKRLHRLDERFRSLTQYKKTESSYRDKKIHITTIEHDIERLQSKRNELLSEQVLLNKQQHALSSIKEYEYYQEKVTSLPENIPFPEDGIDRLKRIKDKLLPLQSEWDVLAENSKRNKQTYEDIEEQLYNEQLLRKAQHLVHQRSVYNERKQSHAEHQQFVQHEQLNLDNQLHNLQIGLQLDDLDHIHFPFHVKELWQILRNDVQQLTLEEEQLQHEQNALTEQQQIIKSHIKDVKSKRLPREKVHELHNKIDMFQTYHTYELFQRTREEQQQTWEKKNDAKVKKMSYILSGSLLISLVLGMTAFLLNVPMLYHAMIVLIVIGCGQWYFGKQSIKQMKHVLTHHERVDESRLRITAEEKNKADKLLQIDDDYKNRLHSLNDQLRSLDIQLIQLEEKKASLEQRKQRLDERILLEHNEYPFLSDVDITYWLELYHKLEQLKKSFDEIQRRNQHIQQLEEKQSSFEQTVRKFCQKIKIDDDTRSIGNMLHMIEQFIEEQKHLHSLYQSYEKLNDEINEQQKELKTHMHTYEQEIKYLLNIAQVKTEEDFYKQAAIVEQKQSYVLGMKKIEQQLAPMFPSEEWKDFSEDTLDKHALNVRGDHIEVNINDVEEKLDEKRQALADIKADIVNMETSDDYSKAFHQFAMEKEQLHTLAKEWAVIKTAQHMLAEAKRHYRDKYLTHVIEQTTKYFCYMTNEAYTNVYALQDHGTLQVEAFDSIRYDVNELSQGTVDQLYIALRLAISHMMSSKQKLPFIIDDAFIHSDHVRTQRIIDILLDISHRQQMILFTCNEDIIKSINEKQVIRLENRVRIN